MTEARLTQYAEQLAIGLFGGMVQAAIRVLLCRDGPEEQIAAHGGGNFAAPVNTNRLITTPDFASTWPFQQRKVDFNERAGESGRQWGSERYDAERVSARCGEPSAQACRFDIVDFDVTCGIENALGRRPRRGSVSVSHTHSWVDHVVLTA
jgi:hypothetical protein